MISCFNGSVTTSYVISNTSVSESSLSYVIYNWNGTNYTVYNTSDAVFIFNLNNNSVLGENSSKAVDSTGAGDAFASGFVYGIINGRGVDVCMNYGYKEASSVLRHIGAKNDLLRKL